MIASKIFIELYAAKNADIIYHVPSKSNKNEEHLIFRKEGKWFCDCVAGVYRQECSHVRSVMKETGNDRKCFYCGSSEYAAGGMHKHHVRKRSTHPDMIDDESNLMLLCPRHHHRTETDNEFYESLQVLWDLRHDNKTRSNNS